MSTLKTLREYVRDAELSGAALGHFNIANLEMLHGVLGAAKKLGVPVIIGLSEGEESFVGINEAVGLIKTIREKENFPVFLNADHHTSFEKFKTAADAGFDSLIFDGAKLDFEENIKETKKCVEYARTLGKTNGRDIMIEAELGYIGTGSDMKDSIPEGACVKTSPDDAKKFVEETGVDLLAPSVGNIHGLLKGGNPKLDAELVKKIREAAGVPLVLHGGSGIADEDFALAIKAGISVIHISTEIRLAYENALKESLGNQPNELAPYKILRPVVAAVEEAAYRRLKLFSSLLGSSAPK